MEIILPIPPSDNHLYGMKGKKRFMYQEGRDWKEEAQMIAKSTYKRKPTTKPLTMTINFYLKRDRDVHGSGKLIADSLEGIVYVNDKQIKKMIFEKFIDKENPPVRAKRISFDEYNMEHLYSMAIDNFEENCVECQQLKKRIEKFLGEEIVNEIKKIR